MSRESDQQTPLLVVLIFPLFPPLFSIASSLFASSLSTFSLSVIRKHSFNSIYDYLGLCPRPPGIWNLELLLVNYVAQASQVTN